VLPAFQMPKLQDSAIITTSTGFCQFFLMVSIWPVSYVKIAKIFGEVQQTLWPEITSALEVIEWHLLRLPCRQPAVIAGPQSGFGKTRYIVGSTDSGGNRLKYKSRPARSGAINCHHAQTTQNDHRKE